MRKTLAILCVLALASPAWAALNTWTAAGSGNWATTASWSDGIPTADDDCFASKTSAYTITVNQPGAVCHNIDIGYVGTASPPCKLSLQTGGDLSVEICIEAQNGGYGLYEQTGGVGHISGLRIGRYGSGFGKVEISGGTMLPCYREFYDTGGTVPVYLGIGDAGTRVGYRADRQGAFEVIGSNSSITVLGGESSGRRGFELNSYGTLIARLDEGGISTIVVDTSRSSEYAYPIADDAWFDITVTGFAPVIDITGTEPALNTSLTLLTADRIYDEGVVLDASDLEGGGGWGGNYWTLTVTLGTDTVVGNVNNGDNGSVVVTYVPEPATMALLGLGGLGVLLRRRR